MHIRSFTFGVLLTVVAISAVAVGLSQEVLRHPKSKASLKQRWEWGEKQAGANNFRNGYWIGYSIKKLMNKNSYTGSFRSDWKDKITLSEIIYGNKIKAEEEKLSDGEIIRRAAREALDELNNESRPQKKIVKELAILFHFTNNREFDDLKLSNLSLHIDLEGLPLIWLGKITNEESIPFLNSLYKQVSTNHVREEIVTTVGIHPSSEPVFTFLSNVLNSRDNDDIREKAVFWLGQQDDKRALKILVKTARNDRSGNVREKAVFAISQLDIKLSEDALIDLAQNAEDKEVREKAIFWMGQTGGKKILKILGKIALDDVYLGEKAVFAISQMKSTESLDFLIDLAYNAKNRKIRKKAIFWLGQKASKKSRTALKKVAFDGDDTEIQKQAVFAIAQLPQDESIPELIKIGKTHPNYKIRKQAIFWLGQTEDHRAVDFLAEIVKKK